jgi:hypothetical protein
MFLVELWREPSALDTRAGWRGIVKHLAHEDEHYIAEMSDITTFIARCAEAVAPSPDVKSSADGFRTRG